MKVLIITYYWPPAGGSGVQRWLKFVKYLQDYGITPVVYTVENPDYALEDSSLVQEIPDGVEVLRQPVWEPYKLANLLNKGKASKTSAGFLSKQQSIIGKLSNYIRANYFIPDARMFWIRPSINYLEKYLRANPVDAVISTGPPHSVHRIGLGLKKRLDTHWLADFRDPWTEIDYFHQLPLTKSAIRKHQKQEKEVLTTADCVVVVGETMRKNYLKFNPNTQVLTNGYDGEKEQKAMPLDTKFSITHIGLMNEDRNPYSLWKVLAEMVQEVAGFAEDLEIKLIGKVDAAVLSNIDELSLTQTINHIDYLPHSEVQKYQRASQVLLLAVNKVPSAKGIITGKIFEYLLAKRPILAVGPEDGDLAGLLTETEAGTCFDFDNSEGLKASLLEMYKNYKNKTLTVASKHIEKYHRKEITGQLAALLKTNFGK